MTREDWWLEAACRDQPSSLFFPDIGDNANPAKQLCASCDVRDACLDFALRSNIDDGVWGGYGPKERRRIKRKRRQVA